jgi:hypothetical protein
VVLFSRASTVGVRCAVRIQATVRVGEHVKFELVDPKLVELFGECPMGVLDTTPEFGRHRENAVEEDGLRNQVEAAALGSARHSATG